MEFKAKVQFKITLNLIPEKQRNVILFFNAPTLGLISFKGQLEVRIGVRNYLLEFWRFSSLLLFLPHAWRRLEVKRKKLQRSSRDFSGVSKKRCVRYRVSHATGKKNRACISGVLEN